MLSKVIFDHAVYCAGNCFPREWLQKVEMMPGQENLRNTVMHIKAIIAAEKLIKEGLYQPLDRYSIHLAQ